MSLNNQLEIEKENKLILAEEAAKLERERAGSDLNLAQRKDGQTPLALKIETNKS